MLLDRSICDPDQITRVHGSTVFRLAFSDPMSTLVLRNLEQLTFSVSQLSSQGLATEALPLYADKQHVIFDGVVLKPIYRLVHKFPSGGITIPLRRRDAEG